MLQSLTLWPITSLQVSSLAFSHCFEGAIQYKLESCFHLSIRLHPINSDQVDHTAAQFSVHNKGPYWDKDMNAIPHTHTLESRCSGHALVLTTFITDQVSTLSTTQMKPRRTSVYHSKEAPQLAMLRPDQMKYHNRMTRTLEIEWCYFSYNDCPSI